MKDIFDGLEARYEILNDIPKYCLDLYRVGYAYKRGDDEHYLLRLNTLPGMKFYLMEHSDGMKVIYTGFIKKSNGIRFFNPVGYGEELENDIMKLKFTELKLICYLQLSPKDYHYTAKAA